ncbi:MAG: type II secretion system protein GspK [Planctomycetota bacterium]
MFISNRKGSVLVIVIWILSLLSILAVSVSVITSAEIYFIKRYRNQATAYFIARAGILQAIAELELDKSLSAYDALNENWSNKPELFSNRKVGSGFFSLSYAYSPGLTTQDAEGQQTVITNTFYGMMDEERKININTASMSILQALFQERAGLTPSQTKEISDSIVDWRDQDDTRRENGAENGYYQSLPQSYSCKNNRFDVLEELILVKGMKPDIFYAVKDFITLYGDGKVNINTAPYPVLRALGSNNPASDSLANKIIRCRAGADGIEGTEDDGVFMQTSSIITALTTRESLTSSENALIKNLLVTNVFTVQSNYFRIISEGYFADIGNENTDSTNPDGFSEREPRTGKDKKNSKKITCIVHRNGKIVYWQE